MASEDDFRDFISALAEAVHREIKNDPEMTAAYLRRLDEEAEVVRTLALTAATHDTTTCPSCAGGLKFGPYCPGVEVASWSDKAGKMGTAKALLMALRMLGDRLVADGISRAEESTKGDGVE